MGWIGRGFPQQGFFPPTSYCNMFLSSSMSFSPYLIICLPLSEFIRLYLNLFELGPPFKLVTQYIAIHDRTIKCVLNPSSIEAEQLTTQGKFAGNS